jgi:hypothetical protein
MHLSLVLSDYFVGVLESKIRVVQFLPQVAFAGVSELGHQHNPFMPIARKVVVMGACESVCLLELLGAEALS